MVVVGRDKEEKAEIDINIGHLMLHLRAPSRADVTTKV